MNIVYSYLTHHVYNRNSKLDIFTSLKIDVSLFVLSHVCNRQRFPLAAQYTSPCTLLYSKDKQMQALT